MTALSLRPPGLQALWNEHRAAHSVALGIMWGAAASVMEFVVLPVGDESWSGFTALLLWNGAVWSLVGIGIAWSVDRAGPRLQRPLFLAASVVIAALAGSAFVSLVFSIGQASGPVRAIVEVFPNGRDPLASFLFQAWVVAFYGGLYAVAWTLNQRAERTRELLGRAQIAHLCSETLLGEAQLQALRGHVDPGFLLRVMEEVERRYKTAPATADRLVDLLVAFLRLAMPGVRSGRSTLEAELTLARAYADLWADLDPGRQTWAFDAPGPLPDMPFPPLLLLPVLDRLALASPAPERGQVRARSEGGRVTLAFDATRCAGADWLTPELAYRLRVGLSTIFGARWSMSFRDAVDPSAPALRLTIAPPGARDALPPPDPLPAPAWLTPKGDAP
ncbi:MAG: hypothetical protein ACM3QY_12280 [Candidatus Levyibacteriota bacterium]